MYFIPEPKNIREREGSFFIGYDTQIVIEPSVRKTVLTETKILKECIRKWTGLNLAVRRGNPENGDICLKCNPEFSMQEYQLLVCEDGIIAEGSDGAGLMYAVQTLCQMIEQCGSCLACMDLHDIPDIKHRGYYLDESRGRVLKLDYLKKTVDRLCRYKINEFQLYIEHTYMFQNLSEMWRDETPLSAEEILELDRYCRERHIELIPSLASFGHLYTLLGTKSYAELCELEDSEKQPFSFWDRMQHHTINVADDRTLPFIKGMLTEYMELFSSNKFNFCGDETFDLGKGKSKALAELSSVHRIYIDYIKEICKFLVEKGKQPMFWGDVICGEPELVKELPEEAVCLTWGYAPDQKEDESRKMAETGIKQYLCPGVGGWNQWMNLIEDSYRNIICMCGYAQKYQALGILNTDWGDFGHINHPDFSIPGMIYGAAFSWNHNVIPFEEMNRRIAVVEYQDDTGQTVNLLAQVAKNSLFQWWDAVIYYEKYGLAENPEDMPPFSGLPNTEDARKANQKLEELLNCLRQNVIHLDSSCREYMQAYEIAVKGITLWNEIGGMMTLKEAGGAWDKEQAWKLAQKLETWFMSYKELWRGISREGDLHKVAVIIFWYADLLRGREKWEKRNLRI